MLKQQQAKAEQQINPKSIRVNAQSAPFVRLAHLNSALRTAPAKLLIQKRSLVCVNVGEAMCWLQLGRCH
jgi:hypothetical protein